MKITSSCLLLAALSPAALFFSACSKSDSIASVADDTRIAASDITSDVKDTAVDAWDSIKDFTFDKRDDFASGFDHMVTTYDADLVTINATLKGMPAEAAKTRDVAVKEFNSASAACKEQLVAVRASTADTWAASKTNADIAWQRMHKAFTDLTAPSAS